MWRWLTKREDLPDAACGGVETLRQLFAVSEEGLELIKHHEGFVPHIYLDAAGFPTIGYGHLIKADEDFSDGIDKVRGEQLLIEDVRIAERAVTRLITSPLSQSQFDALVSFTFNLGSGALQRSTLRRVVNRGEHADVAHQLRRWVFAGGRRLRGLIRRREDEAVLYMSGTV